VLKGYDAMRSFEFIKPGRAALLSVLLSALVALLPAGAFAASSDDDEVTVAYTGNGSTSTVQVLNAENLDTFKNLMPGGSTQPQNIVIQNRSSVKMNVYFQAKPTDSESAALLEELQLTVTFKMDDSAAEKTLYQGPASGKNGTTGTKDITSSLIKLGYIYGNSTSGVISAVLTAPETMGNEYQSSQSSIEWVVQFERTPSGGGGGDGGGTTSTDSNPPESIGPESTPAAGPSSAASSQTSGTGENIPAEGIPLSPPPKTGQNVLFPVIISAGAGISLLVFLIARRKASQS
jgi:hypothetical protein